MVKKIKTQMGFQNINTEEMLLTVNNMIYKFAHNCSNNLENISGNVDDFEDYVQLGRLEAIKAFKNYDSESGVLFITYLTNALRYVYIHLVRDMNAQKRKVEKPLIYINKEAEEGRGDGNNVIKNAIEDEYFCSDEESKLGKFIMDNITSEDATLLNIALKKQIGKASKIHRGSLMFTIDFFSEKDENVDIKNKSELAEALGITRPTLNKRIDAAVEKIQNLVKEYIEKNK